MNGLRPAALVSVFAAGLIVTAVSRAIFGPNVDNVALDLLVLAAVGSATAGFERDDPPRASWMMLTLAVGFVSIAHLLTPFTPNVGTVSARHVFTFAHNVGWVVAFWLLHRVFERGGIPRPWTRRWRNVFVGMVAVSAFVAAWILWRQLGPLIERGSGVTPYDVSLASVNASSGVANACVLVLAIDLARTLVPLRAGTLAQPYVLLACGAGLLLTIDVAFAFVQGTTILALGPVPRYVSAIAWTSVGAAGLSQARILRGARRPATS